MRRIQQPMVRVLEKRRLDTRQRNYTRKMPLIYRSENGFVNRVIPPNPLSVQAFPLTCPRAGILLAPFQHFTTQNHVYTLMQISLFLDQ